MSAQRRSGVRSPKVAASVAAGAMLVTMGLGLAPSHASESPSPTPATTDDGHATNPDFTPPEIADVYVGQSVQARKTADGVQNAQLANFRWAVTQVNAESLNGLDVSLPLPMDNTPGLRSLTGGSNAPTEVDGGVLYDFDNVDGIQTKRTLNLWPQDRELPVDVSARFTLDGETVNAADIVGKGGLVTATYTIHNKSVQSESVEFENVDGNADTATVDTSQAFVGISKQFIPQSWAQFDPGHGIFGADGRGNFQTQWITLAFLPFAEGGEASFGWSAVIPDGQGFIPKMVIEVSPLYVPPHAEGEEEAATAEAKNGVPKPNLDPATAMIHAGVEDLIAGIEGIASLLPEEPAEPKPPLTVRLGNLSDALTEGSTVLGEIIAAIDSALAGGGSGDLTAAVLARIDAAIADQDQAIAEANAVLEDNNCATNPANDPPAVAEVCAEARAAKAAAQEINVQLKAARAAISSGALAPIAADKLTEIRNELEPGKEKIDTINSKIQGLLDTIAKAQDAAALAGSGKSQISAGIGAASEEVSAYIAQLVAAAQAAAAEGKDAAAEVKAHLNTTLATLAGLKGRMAQSPLPYGGGYNTAYAPAGDPSAVQAAATAMLPNTTQNDPEAEAVSGVVPTAELFGAYQFMLDPADSNHPNTPWRILLAVLFVVGAGFLGKRVASRGKA